MPKTKYQCFVLWRKDVYKRQDVSDETAGRLYLKKHSGWKGEAADGTDRRTGISAAVIVR